MVEITKNGKTLVFNLVLKAIQDPKYVVSCPVLFSTN